MNTCISLKISWQENNYRFFSDGAGVKVEDMHMMQPENKLKFFTSEVRFLEKSKQKCEKTTYKNRYKHKLNMLWPGQTMLKIVGMFLLIGILFWLLKCRVSASAAFVRRRINRDLCKMSCLWRDGKKIKIWMELQL